MKILITGGTGFIGQALIKQLELLNHQVLVLSRNKTKAHKILGE